MDTLAASLELIRAQLNAALQAAEPRADDWVSLTNVIGQDGVAFEDARDKVAMMLVNIASDATLRSAPNPAGVPPMRLDLLVAFVANFENRDYAKGLTAIARTIAFFQQTPVFTVPGPGAGIGPLSMLAADLSLADVSGVMGMLGLRYRPSVFYQLRGVSVG